MVALLAGQQTCDSPVAGLRLQCIVALRKLLNLCSSVTKQYNLVLAKEGDFFGWESNHRYGGK